MTKRWKLKTNSSNILLVLITLILVTAKGQSEEAEDPGNSIEGPVDPKDPVQMYVGNDEISSYFFRPSATNNSRILEDVTRCLDNFQLVTCLKMLLLDRINGLVTLLEDPSLDRTDFRLAGGMVVFERKTGPENREDGDQSESLSLDEEISTKVLRMFRNRCLRLNLLNVKIEIEPTSAKTKDGFVCFSYKIQTEEKPSKDDDDEMEQGRKKRKRGKGGMSMMMMLPQLIMLGFMPFTLASLKAMVMNAVMINMMALNGAIFMTIRNLVFGPRSGDNVKYVNYGYSKDRQTQSRRPVLIIHSPAAFVKQPQIHKKKHSPYSGLGYFPAGHSPGPVQSHGAHLGHNGGTQSQSRWDNQQQRQKFHRHRQSPTSKLHVAGNEHTHGFGGLHHQTKEHYYRQTLHPQQQIKQRGQHYQQQRQNQQQEQWQQQRQQQPEHNAKNNDIADSPSNIIKSNQSRFGASSPMLELKPSSSQTEPEELLQQWGNEETNTDLRWDPIDPFQRETSFGNKSEIYSF